jgi:AcrR family transcriptional regulator
MTKSGGQFKRSRARSIPAAPVEARDESTRREQARRALCDAAATLFAARGDVTVRDIAEAAGLNHALVHYYFGSKEALFDAAFEYAGAKAVAKLALAASDSADDIADKLFALDDEALRGARMVMRELLDARVGATAASRRPAPLLQAVAARLHPSRGPPGLKEALAQAAIEFNGFVLVREWLESVAQLNKREAARVAALVKKRFANLIRPWL